MGTARQSFHFVLQGMQWEKASRLASPARLARLHAASSHAPAGRLCDVPVPQYLGVHRGQAYSALGKVDAAVEDLRRALLLSPENEKGVIREKLQEAEQKQRHASRGGAGGLAGCLLPLAAVIW